MVATLRVAVLRRPRKEGREKAFAELKGNAATPCFQENRIAKSL